MASTVAPAMADRLRALPARRPALPMALLALLVVVSLAARAAFLGDPCRAPCRSASDHQLIFDESYYVNAARVIAGIHPPHGSPYTRAPLGDDPNAEHPQLAKLIMAGSIELFGDGPLAWRLGSLLFGAVAIGGMFALVRTAGGGSWLALGAAALMASDNLLLVHGRIGTLDIYVVGAMVWAAVLYLRGNPLLAGVVTGVAACFKLVGPYLLVALAVLEVLRVFVGSSQPRPALWRLARCVVATAAVLIGLLAVLQWIAPPYDDAAGKLVGGGAPGHLAHMVSYAANQTSPHGPTGIASYPWQWLGDYKPIVYLSVAASRPGDRHAIRPPVHFWGMISPPILALAVPALLLAAWGARRIRAARRRSAPRSELPQDEELTLAGLAWCLGTFLPFELQSLLFSRTSYLYYMVIVMPGIYVLVAKLSARLAATRRGRWLVWGWGAAVVAAVVVMYPLTPLP